MTHRTSNDFNYKGDIFTLLAKAAAATPGYPAHLMCETKIKFFQQIIMFSIASGRANQGTNILGANLN